MFGTFVSVALYIHMDRLQKPLDETNQKFKIKFGYSISIFANLLVVAADFAGPRFQVVGMFWQLQSLWQQLLGTNLLSIKVPYHINSNCCYRLMAFGTAFVDIIQLRGFYAQTHPGNIVCMQTSTSDESIYIGHPGDGL